VHYRLSGDFPKGGSELSRIPEPIVDFHVHLFPDGFFDAIWRFFKDRLGVDVLYRLYWRPCVAHLRERGVGPIVFSNYAHKKGVAKTLNDFSLAALGEDQDLYCFAAYHPDDDDAVAMAERMLDHPRILGIKLQCVVQDLSPLDGRLFPMYERVIERGKRLLLHAGTGPVRAGEHTGVATFRRLLRRYPDLPAVVPHMGGLEFQAFLGLLDDHPLLYLDTSYAFVPGTPYRFPLGAETLERHRGQILYGSDFPNVIHPRESEIRCLEEMGLSADFYAKVFRDNGLKLLGRG
jgi:uncharacterized protein